MNVWAGLAAGLAACGAVAAAAAETAPPPRRVYESPREQAAACRAVFEGAGRAGLPELAKSRDTGLALAAAWEMHKKVARRAKKGLNGGYDTYDPAGVKQFLAALSQQAAVPVPKWWSEVLLNLEVETGRNGSHLIDADIYHVPKSKLFPGARAIKFEDREWLVRDEVTLSRSAEASTYTAGRVSLVLPKRFLKEAIPDALADAPGDAITCLAPYTRVGGFRFAVAGFDSRTSRRLWEAQCWATGRTALYGSSAWHRAELVIKGGAMCVFGAEMWGAYAEGFDLETGRCRFRFCTSFWGDYSEGWDIK